MSRRRKGGKYSRKIVCIVFLVRRFNCSRCRQKRKARRKGIRYYPISRYCSPSRRYPYINCPRGSVRGKNRKARRNTLVPPLVFITRPEHTLNTDTANLTPSNLNTLYFFLFIYVFERVMIYDFFFYDQRNTLVRHLF